MFKFDVSYVIGNKLGVHHLNCRSTRNENVMFLRIITTSSLTQMQFALNDDTYILHLKLKKEEKKKKLSHNAKKIT